MPTAIDSPRLREIVAAFAHLKMLYGAPPTIREVADHVSLAPSNVQHYVSEGLRLGLLRELRPGNTVSRNIVAAD